jgi:hypothetical protein
MKLKVILVVAVQALTLVCASAQNVKPLDARLPPLLIDRNSVTHSLESRSTLFSDDGYVGVRLFEEKSKGWFCGVGQKPGAHQK